MLKKERQAYILRQVNLHNSVLSSSLEQEMKVSEDTIRRDLQELAGEGKLIKVHGGALSYSFGQVYTPPDQVYLQTHKQVIGRKAASLVKDGMFVLTMGGSTIVEMARALPPQLKATFISGSITATLEYMKHPAIDTILIGDRVSKQGKVTVGAEAIARVRQIKADLCFQGIHAIDIQHGITESDWEVVQLKKAMIESSQKVVCLTISEKLNSLLPVHICHITEIDILITELDPSDPLLQPYIAAGITVL